MRRPALAAWAALTCAAPASASPLFELTGAVQGAGGFNARVVEAGAASAYFNPASLPDAPVGFDLGVFVLADQIGVALDGRASPAADVPIDSVNMERPGGGRYPLQGIPTVWLDQGRPAAPPDPPLRPRPRQASGSGHHLRVYQALGFVQRLWGGHLAVGLYAMIPYSRFTGAAAFYSDQREQFFSNSLHPELYGDRLTATSLSFGAGARLTPTLSVGGTFTLSLRTTAATPTYLTDVGRFETIMVDSDVGVNTALAPHFGAVYRPTVHTRLAATVHTPQKLQIDTDFSFLLANGIEQRAVVHFTHDYLPWLVGVGLLQDLLGGGDSALAIAGTVLYARWSRYVDRHGERPPPGLAWFDTVTGTLGLRWRQGAACTFLDVTYQPSPVPDQTGRTTYVDSGRAAASGGFDYRAPVLGGTLRAGLQAQVHRLLPRRTAKREGAPDPVVDEVPDDAVVGGEPLAGRTGLQTNNPGWPGFASGGWILGAGVNVSLSF
jgi:long-chain fatty acid transport protein